MNPTVALKDPAALGVKATLKLALCPAATVTGNVGEDREKYFVETEALLMVRDFVPEFVAVTLRVFVVPAVTLPKANVDAPMDNWPIGGGVEEPALTPWQPVSTARPAITNIAQNAFVRTCGGFFLETFIDFGGASQGKTACRAVSTVCGRGGRSGRLRKYIERYGERPMLKRYYSVL